MYFAAQQFTHGVNVSRKPDVPAFAADDLTPWSRKQQIKQTGIFDSKADLLARLNG